MSYEYDEAEILREFFKVCQRCVKQLDDSPKSFFSNVKQAVEAVEEFYNEE